MIEVRTFYRITNEDGEQKTSPGPRQWVRNRREALTVGAKLKEELDVYWGVNSRDSEAGDNENVPLIEYVVLDFDSKDFKGSKPRALKAVRNVGLQPTVLVDSGNGYHAYYKLEPPVPDSDEFREARRELCHATKSDSVFDAARILRIPGTLNHKSTPPKAVRETERHDVTYPAGIFGPWSNLRAKLRRAGTAGDPGERSEIVFNVMRDLILRGDIDEESLRHLVFVSEHPLFEKYRENPGAFKFDWEKLDAERKAGVQEAGRTGRIREQDNCYWVEYDTDRAAERISSFVLRPKALLTSVGDDQDVYLCDVASMHTEHVWEDQVFPKNVFSSKANLIRHLKKGSWIWEGTDAQVVRLESHLMSQIVASGIPRTQGVTSIGRHGDVWVTESGCFDAAGSLDVGQAPYWYAASRDSQAVHFAYPEPPKDYDQLVRRVYELLPRVNLESVTLPVIGWFFAAPLKPYLYPGGLRFPILQIYGTRGSGKTTLEDELMFPLFGGLGTGGLDSQTTPFALIRALSFSTSVPLGLSEFRASQRNVDDLLRYLRLSYDSGYASRGRADQTVVSYDLTAPLVVDGEDAIDDSAVNERSILVHLVPETIRDLERQRAYQELVGLPLEQFAKPYIQYTLDQAADVQQLAERWRDRLADWFGSELPPRVFESYARVAVGLQLYRDFGRLFGAQVPKLSQNTLRSAFSTTTDALKRSNSADGGLRVSTVLDEFLEDAALAIAGATLGTKLKSGAVYSTDPFLWRYERDEDILWLNLKDAHNWWTQQRRSRGANSPTIRSLKSLAKERIGDFVVEPRTKSAGSTNIQYMHGFDLEAAREAGIEVVDIRPRLLAI